MTDIIETTAEPVETPATVDPLARFAGQRPRTALAPGAPVHARTGRPLRGFARLDQSQRESGTDARVEAHFEMAEDFVSTAQRVGSRYERRQGEPDSVEKSIDVAVGCCEVIGSWLVGADE